MRLKPENRARPALSVEPAQVAAFRLHRHHLLARAARSSMVAVAGDIGGVHAQLASAARLSLATRVRGLAPADVDRALSRTRSLVKVWCMRRTLHVVPAKAVSIFVRGTSLRADRDVGYVRRRGYSAAQVHRLASALLQSLDEECTVDAIADRVGVLLGAKRTSRPGGGWGSRRDVPAVGFGSLTFPAGWLLHLAGAYGVVCVTPGSGNVPKYIRADAWIPHWEDVPVPQAEDDLLRRYLRVAGPAQLRDFAWWTGLRLRDAARVWSRLLPEMAGVDTGEQRGWVLASDLSALESARLPSPSVRLLPYFDSYVLQHEDKTALLPRSLHHRLYRPQGWIAPALLVDGRVVGVWSYAAAGPSTTVRVEPFGPLSSSIIDGIEREADELGRFLGRGPVTTALLRPGTRARSSVDVGRTAEAKGVGALAGSRGTGRGGPDGAHRAVSH